MMFLVKKLPIVVLGMAMTASLTFSVDKLGELKKRKVELEQLGAKCEAMGDADKVECLEKRQKKVDKYKSDLESYKADVAKEEVKRNERSAKEAPKEMGEKINNRQSSIKEFTDYVNSCTEKSDRCASALYQVGNLTYLNEEDQFLVKQQKYEKEFQVWEDHDRKTAEPVQPKRNHNASLKHFERFLKEYANHKDAPSALFRAAFISDMLGNEDRAYEYLTLLVTRFPQSELVVQSHLRLGEYWLLKRKYAKAIEHYEKIPTNYPGNEAALALYHRAEAYYNLADFENAAKWYYEYVTLADQGKLKGDLRDEAMQFMAAAWADMDNGFEVAEKFLNSKGNPKWENDVYFEIAMKNKAHDRLQESVKAFKFLLDKEPTYSKAPIADLNVVEILVINKKAEEAQQARMDIVKRYDGNSEWSQKNSSNKQAYEEASNAIKMAMYQIPVYYHFKGEEGKGDAEMMQKAEAAYRDYLNKYASDEGWDVYQVHQNLAVLYNKLKDYTKSAEEWTWCANANTNKMGKLPAEKKDIVTKADAAYNVVIMMEENRKLAVEKLKGDKVAAYEAPETRDYFAAVDKYMAVYGQTPNAGDLAYNAAFLHYEAKQFQKAIPGFAKLLEVKNQTHVDLIRRALAQSLLEDGQFEAAEKQFTILTNVLCPKDKQCPDVRKSLAATMFKQAEAKGKTGDHSAAALKYEQMAKKFRDVDIADKAMFEAGLQYDSAGRTEEGVRVLLGIHNEFPKSDLRIKSILKAAAIYQAKNKFRDAAETFILVQRNYPDDSLGFQSIGWSAEAYEKVPDLHRAGATYESAYKLYPKNDKTPSFLYNGGQIYETAKSYEDAVRTYQLIAENYPKSQYAIEAQFSVPLILESKGDFTRAASAYEAFVKDFDNDKNKLIRAHLGAGKNYENLNNEKKAVFHYSAAIQIQEKYGQQFSIPSAIAAEAGYRMGELYYKKILKIRLDGNKKQNANRIGEVKQNVAPAITSYAKSAQMAEVEWTLRSTIRMGDVFFAIATISDNERVQDLSRDEQISTRIETKATIPGYLDKARELYQKNLEVAVNQGIESPWIDSTGIKFMQAYRAKGQAMEDLSKLLLNAPIPKGSAKDAKEQLTKASTETMEKVVIHYKEAIRAAQTYGLVNEHTNAILSRLKEMEPAAEELSIHIEPRSKANTNNSGGSPVVNKPE